MERNDPIPNNSHSKSLFFGICLLENLLSNTVFHAVYQDGESFERDHDDQLNQTLLHNQIKRFSWM